MDDSTFLIVGANGQLGQALGAQYPNAQKVDLAELDISDREAVNNYDWSNVKVILNAAAYTNVDGAETPEGRITAWSVNASAVSNLVNIAIKNDLALVHISTDYVFDGSKPEHNEHEAFSPLSVYGASKAAGDIAVSLVPKHYLIRTSWVIGEGKNFVRTMLELGKKGTEPSVVADQIGRLTFTSELVRAINHILLNSLAFGTYNVSNSGESASWATITREIFQDAGFNLKVTDTTTEEYYRGKEGVAPRPLNSTLNLDKIQATGFSSVDWKAELKQYIQKELNS